VFAYFKRFVLALDTLISSIIVFKTRLPLPNKIGGIRDFSHLLGGQTGKLCVLVFQAGIFNGEEFDVFLLELFVGLELLRESEILDVERVDF